MKKKYVRPESFLYSIEFNENIASSSGDNEGSDSIGGGMVILFSQSISPCRDYYTKSEHAVTVPPGSSFIQYFMEWQSSQAPHTCLVYME